MFSISLKQFGSQVALLLESREDSLKQKLSSIQHFMYEYIPCYHPHVTINPIHCDIAHHHVLRSLDQYIHRWCFAAS